MLFFAFVFFLNKTKWNDMRNRNSRLLKDAIKLIVDVIIVEEIGGAECINLLLLFYHITQKIVALNNTNVLFYSSRGQKFITGLSGLKLSCQQGHVSSQGSRAESSTCLFQILKITHILCLRALFHLERQE